MKGLRLSVKVIFSLKFYFYLHKNEGLYYVLNLKVFKRSRIQTSSQISEFYVFNLRFDRILSITTVKIISPPPINVFQVGISSKNK